MTQPGSGVIRYSFVGLRAHGHSDQHLEGFGHDTGEFMNTGMLNPRCISTLLELSGNEKHAIILMAGVAAKHPA